MPKLSDIIGKVIRLKRDSGKAIPVKVTKKPEPIGADMETIHNWLVQRNEDVGFYLVIQNDKDTTSFLLNEDHTPVVFSEKGSAIDAAVDLNDPRAWVLELGRPAN